MGGTDPLDVPLPASLFRLAAHGQGEAVAPTYYSTTSFVPEFLVRIYKKTIETIATPKAIN